MWHSLQALSSLIRDQPGPPVVEVQSYTLDHQEFPLVCVFNLEFIQQFLQQAEMKAGLGSCSTCPTLLQKGKDSFIQTPCKKHIWSNRNIYKVSLYSPNTMPGVK